MLLISGLFMSCLMSVVARVTAGDATGIKNKYEEKEVNRSESSGGKDV